MTQWLLVLAAAPYRHAQARAGAEIPLAAEGKPAECRVDVDNLALRGGVEVAVRGEGAAEIAGEALPRLHGVYEGADVGGHGRRHPAGQHQLEVPPRQPVLPFQEECPRQFQAHPDEFRAVDQDEPEGGDGLVVQIPACGVTVCPFGSGQRRHADAKQGVGAAVAFGWRFLGVCRTCQQDAQ